MAEKEFEKKLSQRVTKLMNIKQVIRSKIDLKLKIKYKDNLRGLGKKIQNEKDPILKGIYSTVYYELTKDPGIIFSKYAGEFGGLGAVFNDKTQGFMVSKSQLWLAHLGPLTLQNAEIKDSPLCGCYFDNNSGLGSNVTGYGIRNSTLDGAFIDSQFSGNVGRNLLVINHGCVGTRNSGQALWYVIFEDGCLDQSENTEDSIRYSILKGKSGSGLPIESGSEETIKRSVFRDRTLQKCQLNGQALNYALIDGDFVLEGTTRSYDFRRLLKAKKINRREKVRIPITPTGSRLEEQIMKKIDPNYRFNTRVAGGLYEATMQDLSP